MAELLDWYGELLALQTTSAAGGAGLAGANAAAIIGSNGIDNTDPAPQGLTGYNLLVPLYSKNGQDGLHGNAGNAGLQGLSGNQGAAGANRSYTASAAIIANGSAASFGSLFATSSTITTANDAVYTLDVFSSDTIVELTIDGRRIWRGMEVHTSLYMRTGCILEVITTSTNYRVSVSAL